MSDNMMPELTLTPDTTAAAEENCPRTDAAMSAS